MNRVWIGADERQPLAFNVLQHSIHMASKSPVQVMPLWKHQLPITRFGLTDFTFSRYLVPWLCNYTGTALFMDGDMLVLDDINELFDLHNGASVSVVQDQDKFEWPSLMLFDCAKCCELTPEYVNDPASTPHDLTSWATDVGTLPKEWNVMVMASDPDKAGVLNGAKVLHFTEGLPCFFETQDTPGAAQWHAAKKEMNHTVTWKELMGRSIHAQPVLKQLLQRYFR